MVAAFTVWKTDATGFIVRASERLSAVSPLYHAPRSLEGSTVSGTRRWFTHVLVTFPVLGLVVRSDE
ncbi:MAG: hypothetical protein AUG49_15960 [Catenulispora sp. 13_1_20CM_3_70_7]|nr:MAG: hypothetical protein AUG49_15960 [Catenulispora sp. 13_1_20CM_3_70_7]